MYVCSTASSRDATSHRGVEQPTDVDTRSPTQRNLAAPRSQILFVFARRQAKRATKRVVGTSKKCGCKKQYFFSELNSDTVRIVSPQTVSVRDLVRR